MRLSGFDAIEYAEKEGLTLNKSADSIDDGASDLTIAEAEAIADDHPELIWVDVPADEILRRAAQYGAGLGGLPITAAGWTATR